MRLNFLLRKQYIHVCVHTTYYYIILFNTYGESIIIDTFILIFLRIMAKGGAFIQQRLRRESRLIESNDRN